MRQNELYLGIQRPQNLSLLERKVNLTNWQTIDRFYWLWRNGEDSISCKERMSP